MKHWKNPDVPHPIIPHAAPTNEGVTAFAEITVAVLSALWPFAVCAIAIAAAWCILTHEADARNAARAHTPAHTQEAAK